MQLHIRDTSLTNGTEEQRSAPYDRSSTIIWPAAILMPAGLFFAAGSASHSGRELRAPDCFVVLIYPGIASLALGVVSLGVGLLTA